MLYIGQLVTDIWRFANGNHRGTYQVFRLVREVGIPVDYKNKQHRNSLHWAARGGHINVAIWLLEEGVPIDSLTKDGSTAFQWAVWQGQRAMCDFLIERGTNIHHKNYFSCTAAHWACMGGMDVEFLEYLLSLGIDFSVPNDMGHTPLGKAAFKGHRNHCLWLVKILPNPDLNFGDNNGKTPAMQAASNGFEELATELELLASTQKQASNIPSLATLP